MNSSTYVLREPNQQGPLATHDTHTHALAHTHSFRNPFARAADLVLTLAPGEARPLEFPADSAASLAESAHRHVRAPVRQSHAKHSIGVRLTGWCPKEDLPVDVVGETIHSLVWAEPTANRMLAIVVDVGLKRGGKTVTIRSSLQLVNRLPIPVDVAAVAKDPTQPPTPLATIQPNTMYAVPISAAHRSGLVARPAGVLPAMGRSQGTRVCVCVCVIERMTLVDEHNMPRLAYFLLYSHSYEAVDIPFSRSPYAGACTGRGVGG